MFNGGVYLPRRSLLCALPALNGIAQVISYSEDQATVSVDLLGSEFDEGYYGIVGIGADGVAAAAASRAACCAMQAHEYRRWPFTPVSMLPRTDAFEVLLAAKWSFSVISCNLADDYALARAESFAQALISLGHIAVLLAAGESGAPLAEVTGAARQREQLMRMFLPICHRQHDAVATLAGATKALVATMACRGMIGIDVENVRRALGGPAASVAVHEAGIPGQEPAALARAAVAGIRQAGAPLCAVSRLFVGIVVPRHWCIMQVDQVICAVRDEIGEFDKMVISGITDPTATTASVLLACSASAQKPSI